MYSMFVRRLLGAARYRAMLAAAKHDGAAVGLAVRRLIRATMPFAVAWSDALGLISKAQLKALKRFDSRLDTVQLVEVDSFFGEKVLTALPMEETSATAADLESRNPSRPDRRTGHRVGTARRSPP
ncbi:hypothetical protein [Kitasatospora phosalacinea]|nr:hypothetical protein [Kitasatospora phosalacinea]